MGQGLSCRGAHDSAFISVVESGEMEVVEAMVEEDPSVLEETTGREKSTALHVAAVNGRIKILMFDCLHGRTCLHYAAYYGHLDCLQAILSAASSTLVADSWGFARFVNIRDGGGATPLYLAAHQGRPECVNVLLHNGALVCASTGGYGYRGSTPLHLAAYGGSLDCVRALLVWGADRLQLDSFGFPAREYHTRFL